MKKEEPILRDPEEYPDETVLRNKMGETYLVYDALISALTGPSRELIHEWKYYRDGKAWLCRVSTKKKTVLWISILEGFFKVVFYFSSKAGKGIGELKLDKELKTRFREAGFIGKVKPLVIKVSDRSSLADILRIADYRIMN